MGKSKIADKTVRDIFANLFGEESASKVLSKIQTEFDKGTRGEVLNKIMEKEIEEATGITSNDLERRTIPVQITVYGR